MNTYIPLPNSSAGSPVQFSEPAAYSYESCHCCPRNCQINRTKNRAGVTALPVSGRHARRFIRGRNRVSAVCTEAVPSFFRLHAALLFLPES